MIPLETADLISAFFAMRFSVKSIGWSSSTAARTGHARFQLT